MAEDVSDALSRKQALRAEALAARQRQEHKDPASRTICQTVIGLPEYAAAGTVMCYVSFRDEVRTRAILAAAWNHGKHVVVPYCAGGRLHLFRLASMDELAPGTWEILEPRIELRNHVERHVEPAELDLIIVPGVAFDRRGGRLGYGKGYYDHFLRLVRAATPLVAVAFECQVLPQVPMLEHDVYVHRIVTEKGRYDCRPSPPTLAGTGPR